MSNRFTVSLHRFGKRGKTEGGRGDHLDWFFAVHQDRGVPLVTWSTPICWPNAGENPSLRLPDHRARYLDYDGEISGDRGRVQRLVTGWCRLSQCDAEQIAFEVESVAVTDCSDASDVGDDVATFAQDLCERLAVNVRAIVRFSTSESAD